VVEDLESNTLIINKLLQQLGIIVMNAENGEEALVLLENSTPDLILMDIKMPVMDGFEAGNYIKNNPKFSPIPIIALTASSDLYSKEKLNSVFENVINKPLDNAKLINVLSQYLEYEQLETTENSQEEWDTKFEGFEEILRDQKLTAYLRDSLIEEIPILLEHMLMDDIRKFAGDLHNAAVDFNNNSLKKCSERLLENIEFFDLLEIESNLNNLYNTIKSEG
jgi:CheY-like chemotaxis protein